MCGQECAPRQAVDPGESEFGVSPFARGIDAVLDSIQETFGGVGRSVSGAVSTLLDWLTDPRN